MATSGGMTPGAQGADDGAELDVMRRWDSLATVRGTPRRLLTVDTEQGRYYFLPSNTPVSQHPKVRALGPAAERELQIRQLLRYIDFTLVLELELVNPLLQKLMMGRCAGLISAAARMDAFKIYTDEAYHSYFCEDFKRQIVEVTGVTPHGPPSPTLVSRYHALLDTFDPSIRDTAELLFVSTHERLISGTLRRANDPSLIQGVREIITDHGRDEATHSVYFGLVFQAAWRRIDDDTRRLIAPALAEAICCFLDADLDPIRVDLEAFGFDRATATEILSVAYPRATWQADRRQCALVPLRMFEQCGVYEIEQARDVFQRYGLLS